MPPLFHMWFGTIFPPHQNGIIPDFFNAVPWNHILLTAPKQTKKPSASWNHQRNNPTANQIHHQIAHISQPCPVTDIDDFF